jgi:hypothetical protein
MPIPQRPDIPSIILHPFRLGGTQQSDFPALTTGVAQKARGFYDPFFRKVISWGTKALKLWTNFSV